MRHADQGEASRLDGRDLRIGIVQARFNRALTDRIAEACRAELADLGVAADAVRHVQVPGALEIGVALAALAESDDFDALVAVGCVIRGETYHFDIVAGQSARALVDLGIHEQLCIGNGILTVENEPQALVRADREQADKGGDAARACLALIELRHRLGMRR